MKYEVIMNRKFLLSIGITTLTTLGMATLGFNCSRFEQASAPSFEQNTSASTAEPIVPIAFLTADQMAKTMLSVTGTEGLGELTDPADDAIAKTYAERNGSLPSVQSLNQSTAPTLIAVTNLASSVCAKAVDRDIATGEAAKADRLFFREMDFSKGLSGQTSADAVSMGFERLARNAWRRDVTQTELDTIVAFAQDFTTGLSGASLLDVKQTRLLAVSVCTAALSSLDALTY